MNKQKPHTQRKQKGKKPKRIIATKETILSERLQAVSYNAVRLVKDQNKILLCRGLLNSLKQFFISSSEFLFLASLAADSERTTTL